MKKKAVPIILSLAICSALAGCSSDEKTSSTTGSKVEQTNGSNKGASESKTKNTEENQAFQANVVLPFKGALSAQLETKDISDLSFFKQDRKWYARWFVEEFVSNDESKYHIYQAALSGEKWEVKELFVIDNNKYQEDLKVTVSVPQTVITRPFTNLKIKGDKLYLAYNGSLSNQTSSVLQIVGLSTENNLTLEKEYTVQQSQLSIETVNTSEGAGVYVRGDKDLDLLYINQQEPISIKTTKEFSYNRISFIDVKDKEVYVSDRGYTAFKFNFETGKPLYDQQGQVKSIDQLDATEVLYEKDGVVYMYSYSNSSNSYAKIVLYDKEFNPLGVESTVYQKGGVLLPNVSFLPDQTNVFIDKDFVYLYGLFKYQGDAAVQAVEVPVFKTKIEMRE